MTLVEAAVETLDSALAAERAGADRIELCDNLGEGGTTPDGELVAAIVEGIRLPVFVLIRPRAGNFVYSESEFDVMIRDIELTRTMGIAGIVSGALDVKDRVNVSKHARWLKPPVACPSRSIVRLTPRPICRPRSTMASKRASAACSRREAPLLLVRVSMSSQHWYYRRERESR